MAVRRFAGLPDNTSPARRNASPKFVSMFMFCPQVPSSWYLRSKKSGPEIHQSQGPVRCHHQERANNSLCPAGTYARMNAEETDNRVRATHVFAEAAAGRFFARHLR